MYLKDKNGHLIISLPTSFELSYASICGSNVPELELLSIPKVEDNGYIRFYYKDYKTSYNPDIDDTCLFYLAILKKNKSEHFELAISILKSMQTLRTPSGLILTWPSRPATNPEQYDCVVNLHYLWLSHLLGVEDTVVQNHLLSWLQKTDITTSYYHNPEFILFSCSKACSDFLQGEFKNRFEFLLKEKLKTYTIPTTFEDLKFLNGAFRHIGKDVFFHFFDYDCTTDGQCVLMPTELNSYYKVKEQKSLESIKFLINNISPAPKPITKLSINKEDLKILSSFDFHQSLFYKMGTLRFNKDSVVTQDSLCLFDSTIYSENVSQSNPFVSERSLSIRPHLSRVLAHLPPQIESIIRKYWSYCIEYTKTHYSPSDNSFMGLQCKNINIPPHRHLGARSTLTFILTIGQEVNDAQFIIDKECLDYPSHPFMCLNFDGDDKEHWVHKKDNNTYIYFIFDLLEKKKTLQNKFICLDMLD